MDLQHHHAYHDIPTWKHEQRKRNHVMLTWVALFIMSCLLNVALWILYSDALIANHYHDLLEHSRDTMNTIWKGDNIE